MTRGRRKPYTAIGIKRCKCWRCGKPAQQQWSVCADGNIQRPICNRCDIDLNALVLRWAGDPEWQSKIDAYRRQLMARYPSKKRDPKKVAKKAATKKKAGAKPAAKKAAPKMVKVRKTGSVGKSEAMVREGWDFTVEQSRARTAETDRQLAQLAASAVPAKPPSRWHRFRCAITGLFVRKKHAETNPATTVRERAD